MRTKAPMQLDLWQIDAFTTRPFSGNPAAVIPLARWPADALLQAIAMENNLSETAYFVQTGPEKFHLRWFTPAAEVPLCGHATLASAWLILNQLQPELEAVCFDTLSGPLFIQRAAKGSLSMSLPALPAVAVEDATLTMAIGTALNVPPPAAVLSGRKLLAVWDDPAIIRQMTGAGGCRAIIESSGHQGLIVTAPGDQGYDFISRMFAPNLGIPEDPVTGSAHAMLVPYWAKRMKKAKFRARQVSARGGEIRCSSAGDRVLLQAHCALFMHGQISIKFSSL